MNKEKIDFVIIWVDGSDKNWQKEKQKYSPNKNTDTRNIRYRDWDNLQVWFLQDMAYLTFDSMYCAPGGSRSGIALVMALILLGICSVAEAALNVSAMTTTFPQTTTTQPVFACG